MEEHEKDMPTMLARYFCDRFLVNKIDIGFGLFNKQRNIAKDLLKKYSYSDLCSVLDYLHENPPPKGLHSLTFLTYICDELIPKLKAKKELKQMIYTEAEHIDVVKTNQEMFNRIAKKSKIKGIRGF